MVILIKYNTLNGVQTLWVLILSVSRTGDFGKTAKIEGAFGSLAKTVNELPILRQSGIGPGGPMGASPRA